jgi:hypothetical protein
MPFRSSGAAAKNHRKTLLQAHASLHTERLLDQIGDSAVRFGLKALECDPTEADDNPGRLEGLKDLEWGGMTS